VAVTVAVVERWDETPLWSASAPLDVLGGTPVGSTTAASSSAASSSATVASAPSAVSSSPSSAAPLPTEASGQAASAPTPELSGGSPENDFRNTSEEMAVIDAYPIDEALKKDLKMLHKGGYFSYSAKNYAQAYQAFSRALELYDGNYLDAYWAARAAHKAGQKNAMKLLLEKALTINPQYRPAKQYQEAYGK